jgi:hypothetical protein
MSYKKDLNVPMDNTPEGQQSRINAAGLINSTLENLWTDCYNAMARGNYMLWNTKLDAIWAILGGDVIEDGKEEQEVNKIDLKIYEQGNLNSKVGSGFEKKNNPNSAMLYQLLKKKSLYLRRLQNKQGKGTAYKSEDEDDIN